jgi:hypothetical protein
MTDLLNCPFCGGTLLGRQEGERRTDGQAGEPAKIICANCDARVFAYSLDKAIAAWNRRTLALERLASRQAVVTLEWVPDGWQSEVESWCAASIIGTYKIWWADKAYWMKAGCAKRQSFPTLDEAKALAQADYTQRNNSALAAPVGDQTSKPKVRRDANGNPIPWGPEHDDFMAFDPENPDVPLD